MAGNSNVLRPGHHCQKILFHQQQEALAAHFDFTSFSAWPFLDSWLQPFYTMGVLVGIHSIYSTSQELCEHVLADGDDRSTVRDSRM